MILSEMVLPLHNNTARDELLAVMSLCDASEPIEAYWVPLLDDKIESFLQDVRELPVAEKDTRMALSKESELERMTKKQQLFFTYGQQQTRGRKCPDPAPRGAKKARESQYGQQPDHQPEESAPVLADPPGSSSRLAIQKRTTSRTKRVVIESSPKPASEEEESIDMYISEGMEDDSSFEDNESTETPHELDRKETDDDDDDPLIPPRLLPLQGPLKGAPPSRLPRRCRPQEPKRGLISPRG